MTVPAYYIARIKSMAEALRAAREAGQDLRFVMPPQKFMLIGDLADVGERFARSEDARRLLQTFIAEAPPGEAPTVFMLQLALEHAGIACETVDLAALGVAPAPRA